MKTLKLKMVALALFVSTGFIACSDDDDDTTPITTSEAYATKVEGATTGVINTDISLTVSFNVNNTCGSFNKFIESTTDKTTNVEIEAKYEGDKCGQAITPKTATYKFKVTSPGTYILKFKESETEFITHTIEVIDATT